MRFLDPRFRLVASIIGDAAYSTKARAVARKQAEVIAAECGFSLDDALFHAGVPTSIQSVQKMHELPPPHEALDASAILAAASDDVGNPDAIVEPGVLRDDRETPVGAAADPPIDEPSGQIERALKADPGRSDRDIARECNASPTTIGKARKALGLGKAVRLVVRGGKPYTMSVSDRS